MLRLRAMDEPRSQQIGRINEYIQQLTALSTDCDARTEFQELYNIVITEQLQISPILSSLDSAGTTQIKTAYEWLQQRTDIWNELNSKQQTFRHRCIKHLQTMQNPTASPSSAAGSLDLYQTFKQWENVHLRVRYRPPLMSATSRSRSPAPPQTQTYQARSVTRYARHFSQKLKSSQCLTSTQIDQDLRAMQKHAKPSTSSSNIELARSDRDDRNQVHFVDHDTRVKNTKQINSKSRSSSQGVFDQVDANDSKQIDGICKEIGILLSDVSLSTKLYGYQHHLEVYQAIAHWVKHCDEREREQQIESLKASYLRDIQVKLRSHGQLGKKKDMMDGIYSSLNRHSQYYHQNKS
mmetsp:Transcript_6005/g.9543  ORF Transcript_6005/g.9543 Transcript_6005/m.9543 type:complete len:351 (+) Transcript_6005:27-1079(+)